jgi:hypothetical protein
MLLSAADDAFRQGPPHASVATNNSAMSVMTATCSHLTMVINGAAASLTDISCAVVYLLRFSARSLPPCSLIWIALAATAAALPPATSGRGRCSVEPTPTAQQRQQQQEMTPTCQQTAAQQVLQQRQQQEPATDHSHKVRLEGLLALVLQRVWG